MPCRVCVQLASSSGDRDLPFRLNTFFNRYRRRSKPFKSATISSSRAQKKLCLRVSSNEDAFGDGPATFSNATEYSSTKDEKKIDVSTSRTKQTKLSII